MLASAKFRRLAAVMAVLLAAAPAALADGGDATTDSPSFLPGTQPNELTQPLRHPSVCAGCHSSHATYAANDTWMGTMMANAARDPLFQAALTVANQDIPGSGEICIRCHAPRAWLGGRSTPPLISRLEPDDFESVQCDFCHRLNMGPTGTPYIGTGQYQVADDFVRRGPIADSLAPHEWEFSAYFEDSRLCGLCHDVSNPFRDGFAIERTYTEWAASAFSAEGTTCQRCHLPAERGFACGAPGMPERDVHRHELAGGNYWMPLVLAGEYPELNRQAAYEQTAANAEKMLDASAAVSLALPESAKPGEELRFGVRLTNLTGHKLPTGYPEGRRAWLEVTVTDDAGASLLHSGAYDLATATRADDPQLRTYEVRMAAQGTEGFHFILQDELLQDTRVPPRGFVPAADTVPVGRSYPTVSTTDAGEPVLAHWDDAEYTVALPGEARGALHVSARFVYQTTSREYVESLRDANFTDDAGARMYALWEKYDRAPPHFAATATGTVTIDAPPSEPTRDAMVADAGAGGAPADASVDASAPSHGDRADGCSCKLQGRRGARGAPGSLLVTLPFVFARLLRFDWSRRFRSRGRARTGENQNETLDDVARDERARGGDRRRLWG